MKADLEYYYVADYSPQVKVRANIEGVELSYKESSDGKFPLPLILSPADARELAEILLGAAKHNENLNKVDGK